MIARAVRALAAAVVAVVLGGVACIGNEGAGDASANRANIAAEQAKPNIITIMVDDMRVDDLAALPRTGRLFDAKYVNAYDSLPLCCPARATLLTGQYAHNHGLYDNSGPHGGFAAFNDSNTLPEWMQDAGYRTAMLGKYLNGYDSMHVPPGWDSWAGVVGGLSEWRNYHHFDVNVNGNIRHVDGYQTWHFTGRALSRLGQDIPSDKPLFMWLSYLAPHDGRNHIVPAAPEYHGDSRVGRVEDAFNERDVSDKPWWIRARPRLTKAEVNRTVELRRQRRDALRTVDDGVAKIVNRLRELGELNDTVLIFVSDNGRLLGEHRLGHNKRFPYEQSISIPLLMRGPSIPSGVHREPVVNVDLPSTIVDLAEATPGHSIDGWSLRSLPPEGRPILIESPKGYGTMPAWVGVRTPRWTYVQYANGARELYDMANDPHQLVNRARGQAFRGVQQNLAAIVDRLRDCHGQECLR